MGGTNDADNVFLQDLSLDGLFPKVGLDDWRQAAGSAARRGMGARGAEGIAVETLYSAVDLPGPPGRPGVAPYTRGRLPEREAWEVCQECADPDPKRAGERVAALVRQGVNGVWLRLDRHVRLGIGPDAAVGDGLMLSRLPELLEALGEADLKSLRLRLQAGGNAVVVTGLLLAAARARAVDPRTLVGSVDVDPLGALAADGELGASLDDVLTDMARVAAWATDNAPRLQTVMVSSMPYHNTGASAIEEMALALATGVHYLRVLTAAGLSVDRACARMRLAVGVGRDGFLAVAKIRALRRLVSAAVRVSGGSSSAQAVPVHAVCSPRSMSRRAPWVNLLRTTGESFAAVAAGADVITSWPFDVAIGPPDETATRLAVNTQTILREEAHLGRVIDPAGGSYYVERLSDDLARSAWALLQEIERRGGLASCLLDGWVARRLEATRNRRHEAVATRREPITGVSTFPDLCEAALQRPAIDVAEVRQRLEAAAGGADAPARETLERLAAAARAGDGEELVELAAVAFERGATVAEVSAASAPVSERQRIPALELRREAEEYEGWRDASDRYLEATGRRPQAFIVTLGAPTEHKARLGFVRHLLAAGGIEARDAHAEGAETMVRFGASGAMVAVVCGSDERYREGMPPLATALKEQGARWVIVAGRPDDAEDRWRSAGVDDFVFEGRDVLDALGALHRAAEVSHV